MGRKPSISIPLKHLEIIKTLPENTALPPETRTYVEKIQQKDKVGDLPLSFIEREILGSFSAKFDKSESSVEVGPDGSVKVKSQKQSAQVSGDAAHFNMQKEALEGLLRLEGKFLDEVGKQQGKAHYESLLTKQKETYEALLDRQKEELTEAKGRIKDLEEQTNKGWKRTNKYQKKVLKLHSKIYDREQEGKQLLALLENCDQLMEQKDSLNNPLLQALESQPAKEAFSLARKIVELVEKNQNAKLNNK